MANGPNEILTICGVSMDPFDPRPEQILSEDIAHALSMLTRANGHFDRFYSVAQHSLNCEREAAARGYSLRTRLYCLMHDAPECYLSDLTRPVKMRFPLYYEAEARLQQVVFEALCGGPPDSKEWERVGEIDDALLFHEFLALRGVRMVEPPPVLAAECRFETAAPADGKALFLARYRALADELGVRPREGRA